MSRGTSCTRRWLATVVTLALGAALVAGSTGAAAAGEQPTIEGIPWRLTDLTSGGGLEGLPDGVVPTLLLTSGEASGTAGCNHYSGPAVIRGDSLSFGPLLSTQMLCADPAMTIETAYLTAVGKVARYELDRDDLRLLDDEGSALLVYAPADVPPIAGGWIVSSYQGDDRDLVPARDETLLTAVFGADGTLEGSSGCNHFSGAYALDGDGIAIGPLASTSMACASPELLKQESDLLAALTASDRWAQDGPELTLSSTSGLGMDTTVAMTAASEPSYIGAWVVTGFDKGNGSIVAPAAGSELTLTFAVEGAVDGSSGCNTYSGPATVSGWAMTIGPLAGTRVACASPELDAQEQQLLAALQKVTAWSSDGDGIMLLDSTGSIILTAAP